MAKTPSKPAPAQEPLQLAFLPEADERYTKALGLWDLTPWTVLYTTPELRRGDYLRSIERWFEVGGETYKLILTPARRTLPDGTDFERYPSEREQIVEMAIRKLAIQNRWLTVSASDAVTVDLSFYQIYNELKNNNRALPYHEIEEAIRVLAAARVTISRIKTDETGDKIEQILESTIYSQMVMQKNHNPLKEGGSTVSLQFNALMAKSIRRLEFYRVNYSLLMKMRTIARWVYKRLHHAVVTGEIDKSGIYLMRASDIHMSCGMGKYTRTRDAYQTITKTIEQLAEKKYIEAVETDDVFGDKGKKVDVLYRITASVERLREGIEARDDLRENVVAFKTVAGEEPRKWARRSKKDHDAVKKVLPLLKDS